MLECTGLGEETPAPTETIAVKTPQRGKRRLDHGKFPDPPSSGAKNAPLTLDNVEHLLNETGLAARFNVIKKRVEVCWAGGKHASENDIVSIANLNGLANGWLLPFVYEIARRNPLNPVADWIMSKPWDRSDRLEHLIATVQAADDYPDYMKRFLLRRWLLSATAAATVAGRFHSRGVLTLQGPQGIGKTSWIAALMPVGPLRNEFIKRDHHLDGGDKDSILGGISHWITEIGELDSSFRKDVARLKGFLTNDCDKLRPPYARNEVEFDRRTVFAATVNDEHFLVDQTGNSRFWTISVERLDFGHDIDMQQLFAQLKVQLDAGEQWWLTSAEDEALAEYNRRHRSVSAIAERVLEHIDPDFVGKGEGRYMTAIELLRETGLSYPNNRQCKECGEVLRELLGPPKRVKGRYQWRVPITTDTSWRSPILNPSGTKMTMPDPEDRF